MRTTNYTRRDFIKAVGLSAVSLALPGCTSGANESEPNIVVIFADDLGYGDLRCFGHPTISTPNLDFMAANGMKFTQFYAAASICTPSRAGLLTGRLPIRSGMCCNHPGVLFPNSGGGLPESEITIATALKAKGYATCCIGKWHLGHLPQYLPPNRGFDYYFGIPYSNDMWTPQHEKYPSLPLIEGTKTIETNPDQTQLTHRYTEKAITFIEKNKNRPFFLYFPHTFPHTPLFASKTFKDKSLRGLYGDVVEELDWSVGKILDTLRRLKLRKNTLVIFTSDNGPWLTENLAGGSAGLLRDGKGTTWEGGMREPCVAYWPGKIKPAGINTDIATTMDIFATCLDLAGAALPENRVIDGRSMVPALLGTGRIDRKVMFYYFGTRIFAVRKGPWKMHLVTKAGFGSKETKQDPPVLFNIEHDPSEKYNVAEKHPEIIADITKEIKRHKATLKPVENQLSIKIDENIPW